MATTVSVMGSTTPTLEHMDAWVRAGIAAVRLRELIDTGDLAPSQVYRIVIPARTLSHRVARAENLSKSEADALVRLLRLRDLARATFGDVDAAAEWLNRPSRMLSGLLPMDLLDTESGGRRVEEALVRIAHGQLA